MAVVDNKMVVVLDGRVADDILEEEEVGAYLAAGMAALELVNFLVVQKTEV